MSRCFLQLFLAPIDWIIILHLKMMKQVFVCALLFLSVATQHAVFASGLNPKGYQQLLDAFDAAYMRIIESNQYFDLLESAGLTNLNLLVTDCYWAPEDELDELFPYPDKPKGLLRKVITDGELKYAQIVLPGPPPTSGYGKFLDDLLNAIVDRLEVEYGVSITRTLVDPGAFSNDVNFANVASGAADILIPIASIGGIFEDPNSDLKVRRNKAFLHGCSVAANAFDIWSSDPAITTLQDARDAGSSLTVCYNVQNGGIVRANFPDASYSAQFFNAAGACEAAVAADPNVISFIEFDPSAGATFNVFPANQVSPTAFWVRNPDFAEL